VDQDDLVDALLERGFKKIWCVEEIYHYDELEGFHEIPYYTHTTCYQKEYPWGTATIEESDLEESDITVYINVRGFPTAVVERIVDGSLYHPELDKAYDDLIMASYEYQGAEIVYDVGDTPVEHNFELLCRGEEILDCIDNISSIVYDFTEYLERVAVDLLRKYKPEELEEFKCPRCGATIPGLERDRHVAEHEFEEARRVIVERHEIPGRPQYPLAYKYFEAEIKDLLVKEILPMFEGLAREINRRIRERRLKRLSINQLHHIGDILEIIKRVPKEIRNYFVELTKLDEIMSEHDFIELLDIIEDDRELERIARKPSFNIKLEVRRGIRYIRLYANERRIARLKVDERIKEKIRRKIAEHLVDPREVDIVTEELYRRMQEEAHKDTKTT
jgi:hypothetical protein